MASACRLPADEAPALVRAAFVGGLGDWPLPVCAGATSSVASAQLFSDTFGTSDCDSASQLAIESFGTSDCDSASQLAIESFGTSVSDSASQPLDEAFGASGCGADAPLADDAVPNLCAQAASFAGSDTNDHEVCDDAGSGST